MDRSLDSLSSDFQPLAFAWIARIMARGVAVMVVQTGRTVAEQALNLVNETSGTTLSLHLPRRLRIPTLQGLVFPLGANAEKSDAMDLAPFEQYQLHGPDKVKWDSSDPAWGVIGEEAERIGLRWGGRWLKPFDPGHAEFVLPSKKAYLVAELARPWPTFTVNNV